MMNDEENYNERRISGDAEMVENKWCLKQEKILAKCSLCFHEQSDKIVPAVTQTSFKDTIETVMNWERLSELRFPQKLWETIISEVICIRPAYV